MTIHFFDRSPSGPLEQLNRLTPPLSLIKAGIPSVVIAEDALSIIHRVPTALFDQQLLVEDTRLGDAVNAICGDLPCYEVVSMDCRNDWKDIGMYNRDCPHAFDLGSSSALLKHVNPEVDSDTPDHILIHRASTFHFNIHNLSKTTLNPTPPHPQFAPIRFPTLPAFYDSLIDTYHEPPRPFLHMKFRGHILNLVSYLSVYTLPVKGKGRADCDTVTTDEGEDGTGTGTSNDSSKRERRIIPPSVLSVLSEMKPENRPMLIRMLLEVKPLEFGESVMERQMIKKDRLTRMHSEYNPPAQIPYNPYYRSRSRSRTPEPTVSQPRLTPFLTRNDSEGGKLMVQWGPLRRYGVLVRRMMR